MAKTGTARAAAVAIAMAALVSRGRAFAAPAEVATVVLHVVDYQHLALGDLAYAERDASKVFADIGVRLVWTDGYAAGAAPDGHRHFDVAILNAEMTERRRPADGVFGQASHVTNRAFIYYGRVLSHALETISDPRRALGLVLAHEVGHMLLPGEGHSEIGLMRATWVGQLARVPGFLPEQAAIIRAQLTGTP